MQWRWRALGEAELAVEENVLVLELTSILATHRKTDINFQTPEEPIRILDIMLGSPPPILVY